MPLVPEDQLKLLISRKERLYSRIQITFDMIKNLPNKENIFLSRAESLEDTFTEFNEVLMQIFELNTTVKDPVTLDFTKVSLSFEDLYYEVKGTYDKILRDKSAIQTSVTPSASGSGSTSDGRINKLPTIQIPQFDGKIEKFSSFLSLFNTLVHNINISDIEKFSYLKSLLVYPASQILDSLEFKPENYNIAYKKLVERYSNKRLVAAYHLNKILQLKPFSTENANNFRIFLDTFEDNFKAINALKLTDLSDFIMLHLSLNILDKNTRRAFEGQYTETDIPSFDELCKFVKTQLRVSELCRDAHSTNNSTNIKQRSHKVLLSKMTNNIQTNSQSKIKNVFERQSDFFIIRCPYCSENHKILSCPKFLGSNLEKRHSILKELSRCFSCAGSHKLRDCKSKGTCRECHSNKHNTLLHGYQNSNDPHSSQSPVGSTCSSPKVIDNSETTQSTHQSSLQALSCNTSSPMQVLLSTAVAKICSITGEWITCRVIIDPGSQVNFITNSLADKLGLHRKKCQMPVYGVGEASLPISHTEVHTVITPVNYSTQKYNLNAMVTSRIVNSVPSVPISKDIYKRFSSLNLADHNFHMPGRVDLLIGAQLYSELLADPPSLIKGSPSAILTALGWIIFGSTRTETSLNLPCTSFFTCCTSLHDELRKFWETEEVNSCIPENPDDKYCEEYFKRTVQQDTQGRYVVSLPFRTDLNLQLIPTREIALQKFYKLETRLKRNSEYRTQYSAQMEDYIKSNHVAITGSPSDYVISHHGVSKDSSTTKLRVVFNGSEKFPGSNSLNDLLLPGKSLQTDIGQLIDNFRLYPVALTCDVKQMFRCIRLNPEDRKFVHFFWRSDESKPIEEYELTTLPFGLKSSPFLAQRVIIELFQSYGDRFPHAASCLKEIYVDNIVSGANSVDEALKLYEEIINLFACGKFILHKFSSNDSTVLSHIPESHLEQPLLLDDSGTVKVLGLQWQPSTDSLCYKVNVSDPIHTKRGVLSLVARIFDVNGFLSPVTFWMKCLLQKLWLLNRDWDEALPPDILQNWVFFLEELPLLRQVNLPRCVIPSVYSFAQLIGFADASEKGYGCVVYLRTENSSGSISVHLIRSKSKVSPLKTLSIPRLELNAALILSKVVKTLSEFTNKIKINGVYLFTDSKNVLWWLQTQPHQLKMYVANRIVQILDNTSPSSWHYIPTQSNPADVVSRGLTPRQLVSHSLYWQGPEFLLSPISNWPFVSLHQPSELLEMKVVTLTTHIQSNDLVSFFGKYSSFLRLQRVIAFVMRFINRLKTRKLSTDSIVIQSPQDNPILPLTSSEINEGLRIYIELVQKEYFIDIFLGLQENKSIPTSYKKLSPFVSKEGLLRVGGRLKNAHIPDSAKYPILLPKNSHIATIICDYYHNITVHGGPQLVQSLIQRRFWIPSLRSLLRKRIFRCITCYKTKAKPHVPLMADLPSYRVVQARAFQEVGVDYGGPFLLKDSKRKNSPRTKCWIASFVCMCTKAIHLELVTDLTTSSFLSTLDRFIARRGLPKRIYSDNATNFIGASKKLKEIYNFIRDNEEFVSDHLTKQNIDWKFIPTGAPHFGGLWEASIKSIKHHLYTVIKDHALTFEEFYTLLNRIEALLNSRPLCAVSNFTADNFDYLTPGHFLIGEPLLARPDNSEVLSFSLNSRWELISKSLNHFWKRWSNEYLQTLIPRSKWYNDIENVKKGTLVVIQDKNTHPQNWILARILEAIPGPDGIVRVVKLKTPTSIIVRPVHRILPLPSEH